MSLSRLDPDRPVQGQSIVSLEHQVETPESVHLSYQVVSVGNRLVAILVDTIILTVLNILLFILLVLLASSEAVDNLLDVLSRPVDPNFFGGLILALVLLLFFLLNTGYFLLFEALWNGQTPGKRVAGIRVVRQDGSPVDFLAVAVRNLVRLVDFLPFAYLLGLVVMLIDPYSRRLGDLAAGTLVVKDQAPVTLERVTTAARRPRLPGESAQDPDLLMDFPGIRRLRHRDFALIQESLARFDQGMLPAETLVRLAQVMARRLGSRPPTDVHESRYLLERVVRAYQLLAEEETSA